MALIVKYSTSSSESNEAHLWRKETAIHGICEGFFTFMHTFKDFSACL